MQGDSPGLVKTLRFALEVGRTAPDTPFPATTVGALRTDGAERRVSHPRDEYPVREVREQLALPREAHPSRNCDDVRSGAVGTASKFARRSGLPRFGVRAARVAAEGRVTVRCGDTWRRPAEIRSSRERGLSAAVQARPHSVLDGAAKYSRFLQSY